MKIDLNSVEIEQALVAYIAAQGIDLSGKQTEVALTAGRGPNGYSAAIVINATVDDPASVVDVPQEEEVPAKTDTMFS